MNTRSREWILALRCEKSNIPDSKSKIYRFDDWQTNWNYLKIENSMLGDGTLILVITDRPKSHIHGLLDIELRLPREVEKSWHV